MSKYPSYMNFQRQQKQ